MNENSSAGELLLYVLAAVPAQISGVQVLLLTLDYRCRPVISAIILLSVDLLDLDQQHRTTRLQKPKQHRYRTNILRTLEHTHMHRKLSLPIFIISPSSATVVVLVCRHCILAPPAWTLKAGACRQFLGLQYTCQHE